MRETHAFEVYLTLSRIRLKSHDSRALQSCFLSIAYHTFFIITTPEISLLVQTKLTHNCHRRIRFLGSDAIEARWRSGIQAKFPQSQVDSKLPKILGKFPSSWQYWLILYSTAAAADGVLLTFRGCRVRANTLLTRLKCTVDSIIIIWTLVFGSVYTLYMYTWWQMQTMMLSVSTKQHSPNTADRPICRWHWWKKHVDIVCCWGWNYNLVNVIDALVI